MAEARDAVENFIGGLVHTNGSGWPLVKSTYRRMAVASSRVLRCTPRRSCFSVLADKAYYVYLPIPPQYITHAPQVKGFRHHDGFSLGYRVMFTWLER